MLTYGISILICAQIRSHIMFLENKEKHLLPAEWTLITRIHFEIWILAATATLKGIQHNNYNNTPADIDRYKGKVYL